MGKILILGPDLTQAGFYRPVYVEGVGQWLPGRPLANLATPHRINQAHSLNLTGDSTQWLVDLKTDRTVSGFAMPWGNFLRGDTVSVGVYSDAALSILAGGLTDSPVYRMVKPLSEVAFGEAGFWEGTETEEERARGGGWFDILPNRVTGRYVHVKVNAERSGGGTRSRLMIPRFLATSGFRPQINAAVGSSIQVVDESIRSTDIGGADYYSKRPTRKLVTLIFQMIEENEAMATMLRMAADLGVRGQVFVAWDDQDTVHRSTRSMLATVHTVDPFVSKAMGRFATAFKFREVVA
jgi:hypothetical protein